MPDEPPRAPRANDRALPRLGDRLWRLLWRIRNWLTRGRWCLRARYDSPLPEQVPEPAGDEEHNQNRHDDVGVEEHGPASLHGATDSRRRGRAGTESRALTPPTKGIGYEVGRWVFPSPAGGAYTRVAISQVFRKAARTAVLKDFRFHDRDDGAQQGLHGADRDGAGRMENGAHDATVCGSDGCDAPRGGRGRQRTRKWECCLGTGC